MGRKSNRKYFLEKHAALISIYLGSREGLTLDLTAACLRHHTAQMLKHLFIHLFLLIYSCLCVCVSGESAAAVQINLYNGRTGAQ